MEQKLTISASKILDISGSFVRGNRDKPEYVKQPAYAVQIEAARSMNVVLYDTATQRGWLADGPSALLHLVRTQVVRKPYDGSNALMKGSFFDCSTFKHPDSDGDQRATSDALLNERNMKQVVLRQIDSYSDEMVHQASSQRPRNAVPNQSTSQSKPPTIKDERK